MKRLVTVTLLGLALAGCSAKAEPAAPVTVTETQSAVTVSKTEVVTVSTVTVAPTSAANLPVNVTDCVSSSIASELVISAFSDYSDLTDEILNEISDGDLDGAKAKRAERDAIEPSVIAKLNAWKIFKDKCNATS